MTLPNQLGKEVCNPTLKWIFQIMEGIDVVYFYNESLSETTREVITNLNKLFDMKETLEAALAGL